jgi:segregation and condensation protein B
MNITKLIEAILFYKSEPVSIEKLAQWLETDKETVGTTLVELEKNLENRGLILVRKDDEVMLGTAPEASDIIEKITKEELSRDLGKATIETLSIVMYKGPISRPEIDYIRGVNSSFILRNLMVRGLVERTTHPTDSRSYLYRPTFELLSHLGLSRTEDLPEFDSVKTAIESFVKEKTEDENAG